MIITVTRANEFIKLNDSESGFLTKNRIMVVTKIMTAKQIHRLFMKTSIKTRWLRATRDN